MDAPSPPILNGRFLALQPLGRGGMAEVWLAEALDLGERVAVKLLAPELASDPAAEAALLAEHAHLVHLAHPHIVGVRGAGRAADGRPFYAMECLAPGPTPGARLPAEQVLTWLGQALSALARLHAAGLVHGDVTPANFRPAADGGLRLLDLGLVRPSGHAALTISGTPKYLPPEVARGEAVDARADLYGLACVAWEWWAGQPPFAGEGSAELIRAHLHQPLPPLPPGCPPALEAWLATNLAKAPAGRHPSAWAARAALGLAAEGPPPLLSPGLVGRQALLAEATATLLGGEHLAVEAASGMGATAFLEALGGTMALQGRRLLRVEGLSAQEGLEALGPAALALGLGTEEVAPDPEDPTGRRRTARWRQALVAAGPSLWLVDHAEGLGDAARSLLEALAGQAPQVWTLPPEASGPKEAHRLRLGPLDEAATAELGAKALGVPHLPAALARALHGAAQGQAWAALACLEALASSGALPHAEGRWLPEGCDPAAVRPPAQPDAAWLARCQGWTRGAQTMAKALAWAEAPAPVAVMARVLNEAPQGWAAALMELHQAGAIAEGQGRWRLHPKLAAALRTDMGPSQAQLQHQIWCSAWAQEAEPGPALAWHALAAGEGTRWAQAILASAQELVGLRSWGGAKALAAGLLASEGLGEEAQACAWEVQGDVARQLGAMAEAAEAYAKALALAPTGPKARRLGSLAIVRQVMGDPEGARSAATEAVAAAEAEGLPKEALRSRTRLARLAHASGDLTAALRLAEAALAQAEALGAKGPMAELMGFLALIQQGEAPEAALALALAACAMQREVGDPVGELDAHNMRGNLLLTQGRHREALEAFEEVGRIAAGVGGQGDEEALAQVNQAAALAEMGQVAEACQRAQAGLLTLESRQSTFLAAYARALWGHLCVAVGRLAEGLGQLQEAEASAKAQGSGYLMKLVAVHAAEGRWELGDRLGALRAAQEGRSHAQVGDEVHDRLLAVEARCVASLGAVELAVELCEALSTRLVAHQEGPEAPRLALAATALQAQGWAPEAGWPPLAEPKAWGPLLKANRPGLAAEAWALGARLAAQGGATTEAKRLAALGHRCAAEAGLALLAAGLATWWGEGGGSEDVTHQAAAGHRALASFAQGLAPGLKAAFTQAWRWPLASGPAAEGPAGSAEAASRVAAFGRLVTGSLELGRVLELALDEAMAMVDAERGMIALVEADGSRSGLVVRPKSAAIDGGLMAFSSSLVQAVLEEGKAIGLADAQADERFGAAASVMALDLRTVVCVPLMAGERAIGVLYLDRRSVNARFGSEDLALLEGLASFAALAIHNAREHGAARARLAMLEAFQALRGLDVPKADPMPALDATLAQAKRLAGATRATWWVKDPEGGWRPERGDLDPPWGGAEEAASASLAGGPKGLGEGAWAPARSGAGLLGLIAVGGGRAGLPVPPDEVEALGALANATGRALGARLKAQASERREGLRDGAMAYLAARRGRGMRDAASGLSHRDALHAWLQQAEAQEGAIVAVQLPAGASPEAWGQVGAALDELAPLGGRAARWGPLSALAWTPSTGPALVAVLGGLEDLLPVEARMAYAEGLAEEGPAAWAERAMAPLGVAP